MNNTSQFYVYSASDVTTSPDGQFVYLVEGSDTVIVFERAPNGALIERQRVPRSFIFGTDIEISPDGLHVYVAGTRIEAWDRDPVTGQLSPLGSAGGPSLRDAYDLAFSPGGDQLYLLGGTSGDLKLFVLARDAGSGLLTLVQTLDASDATPIRSGTTIKLTADGNFAYVASVQFFAGDVGSIVVLERNALDGTLSVVDVLDDAGGQPFNLDTLALSPDDAHLYLPTGEFFARDALTGLLTFVADTGGPTAEQLALSPDGAHLYASSRAAAAILVYARDTGSGALTLVETEADPDSDASFIDPFLYSGDAILAVDPAGAFVYASGNDAINSFRRTPATGVIEFADRLMSFDSDVGVTGATAVALAPGDVHLYATGGVDDTLSVFERNPISGDLTVVELQRLLQELDGASSVTVTGDGLHVYATGEHADTVVGFERDAGTGALTPLQVVTNGAGGVSGLDGPVAITATADGASLYVAAAASDSIAVFDRDPVTGLLTFVEAEIDGVGGVAALDDPRDVAVSSDGSHLYAASRLGDAILVFERDLGTGALAYAATVQNALNGVTGIDGVSGVVVSADGAHVYAAGQTADAVAFARNSSTGLLTFLQSRAGASDKVMMSPDDGNVLSSSIYLRVADGTLRFVDTVEPGPSRSGRGAITADGLHAYGPFNDWIFGYERDFAGCDATPQPGCRHGAVTGKAKLVVLDKALASGDRLTWAWKALGESTAVDDFGNDAAGEHYAICLYDESSGPPALVARALAPQGERWLSGLGTFDYRDPAREPEGVLRLLLKAKEAGRATVKVRVKGENLTVPPLPLALPLRVQLQRDDGSCWEATYSPLGARQNLAEKFVGVSDD